MTTNAEANQQPAPIEVPTPQLIAAMLQGRPSVSDLIFSPGRAPQVEVNGQLVELKFKGLEKLTPAHTTQIARDLLGSNEIAKGKLEKDGSADLSYSVPSVARFRVNIFRQRATDAIVMRVIPVKIPTFAELNLPLQLAECVGSAQRHRAGHRPHRLGQSPRRWRRSSIG